MEKNNNSVPEVRFKGFVDAWTQRKLGEVAEFSKGSGYSKGDLTSAGTPIILYGRLYTKYETEINDVDTFVDMRENSVLSKGGEVIVPSSGETAEDISRASVVAKSGVVLGGDLNIVKPNATIYPPFLAVTISNGNQQKELSRRAQGKSVVHISNSDLKDVILQLPCLKEQTQIGSFFRTLDDIIHATQRKVVGLKQLKTAYLQQMFPQAGERVPMVRFEGFSEEWVERKWGEIVKRVSEQSSSDNIPKIEFEDIISGEGRLNKDVSQKFDGRKGIAFDVDNILYGKLRPYLKNWLFADFKGIALGDFWVFESVNSSPIFNYYLMQSDKYQEVANLSTGTKMPRSDWSVVSETDFLIPFDISEQIKIGNFFHNLDTQVTTQSEKAEKLKQLKSAYLQKMFI